MPLGTKGPSAPGLPGTGEVRCRGFLRSTVARFQAWGTSRFMIMEGPPMGGGGEVRLGVPEGSWDGGWDAQVEWGQQAESGWACRTWLTYRENSIPGGVPPGWPGTRDGSERPVGEAGLCAEGHGEPGRV